MIEETVRVVAIEGDQVWVEGQQKTTCGSCSARSACAQGVLSAFFGKMRHIQARHHISDLAVGDTVIIALQEQALVKGALWMYGLPMVALMLGMMLGYHAWQTDLAALLGGAIAFVLSLMSVRIHSALMRGDSRYQPRVLRRVSSVELDCVKL